MVQPAINPEEGGYEAHSLTEVERDMTGNEYYIDKIMSWPELRKMVATLIEESDTFKEIQEADRSKVWAKTTKVEYYEKQLAYNELIQGILRRQHIGMYRVNEKTGVSEPVPIIIVAAKLASYFFGFNCLESAIRDKSITDIYVISYNQIFVEKDGRNELYPQTFESEFEYQKFIKNILQIDHKELNVGVNKIVDSEVYGMRINVVNSNIASKGICFTIRKHPEGSITLDDMLKQKVLNEPLRDLMVYLIQGRTNGLVCGITGSGKTTLLRALLDYAIPMLPDFRRVLVLEDTPELFLKNEHTVTMHTLANASDSSLSVTLDDLNKVALRQKPEYIVVGEVRGMEAVSMVEAMSTGHSTFCTIHAGDSWDAFNRLTTKYLERMSSMTPEVVERVIGPAVDWILIVDNVPGIGRKVTSVSEVSYNYRDHCIEITPIVEYNFEKQARGIDPSECFDFKKTIGKDIQNTLVRRGVKYENIQEMNRRIQELIDKQNEEK